MAAAPPSCPAGSLKAASRGRPELHPRHKPTAARPRSLGGGADLQCTQLFWSLRTGARGRGEAAGVAAAPTKAAGAAAAWGPSTCLIERWPRARLRRGA
eukprot:SAG31_NODE_1261_length_9072_cov_39.512761_9_plen_98_part_01